MRNSYKLIWAVIAVIMATPFASSAKFPGILQRTHLGYSFLVNSAEYKVQQKITVPDFAKDTTYKYDMKTSATFGITIGTYVPIARLGRKSKLVWGIDGMYNMMLWDSKLKMYGGSGTVIDAPFSGATLQLALPTGLDFKFGCDALNVKNIRFCTTLGAGVYPSYSITALDQVNDIDPQFGIAPYAKFEVGVFAGICMKLRAIYAVGNLAYIDQKEKTDYSNTHSQLLGTSNLTLSILVMPFSWTWPREEWWNTY